ncbi:Arc family DNA-binding protein [Anaeromusa sp.]|uniref:Arc family DNA-binding protein n=1 Tax=Anaeromusa sp. TaxID=1872520 RepID=UPI003A4C747B
MFPLSIFCLRIQKNTLEKLRTISKKHERSLNKEITKVILDYVEEYEKNHGPIDVHST